MHCYRSVKSGLVMTVVNGIMVKDLDTPVSETDSIAVLPVVKGGIEEISATFGKICSICGSFKEKGKYVELKVGKTTLVFCSNKCLIAFKEKVRALKRHLEIKDI